MSERVVEVAQLQVYTRGRGWVTWERVERMDDMVWDGYMLCQLKPRTRVVISEPGAEKEAAADDEATRRAP